MPEFKEKVTLLDVVCTMETEKAILVKIKDADEEQYWIPKSQIDDESEVYQENDEGKLVISAWIAEQKGLL